MTIATGGRIASLRTSALLWTAWVAAVTVGYMLYVFPVVAVHAALGLDRLEDPLHSGELTSSMLVLAAVLCGAACGSTIGLAEWIVLRSRLRRAGCWVLATTLGYGSVGLLILIPSAFRPNWMAWAIELIVNGKMHWLAGVAPSWPEASWPAGAATLVMFGAALGIAQWLLLRGRVRRADWWIAITTVGWALSVALSPWMSWPDYTLACWLVPAMVQAGGIVWLLGRPATSGGGSVRRCDNPRRAT